MRIAYVTDYDSRNVRMWSGTGYFIPWALEQQPGVEVVRVGPFTDWLRPLVRARQVVYRYGLHRRHRRDLDPLTAWGWGGQATRAVAAVAPDVVLAPGFIHVHRLQTDVPIVAYTDATFANNRERHDDYANLSDVSRRFGERLMAEGFSRFALTVFSSEWAARSAVEDYGADPARVRVIPLGANLEDPPSRAEAEAALAARPPSPCRLLFIGTMWKNKGGDLAVEVTRRLREAGVEAELTVVGSEPELSGPLPPWLHARGFISKATAAGQAELRRLLEGAHFLIVPTLAEAYGLVFCEASAYAVPSFTRRTGGVPVWDGENGFAFPYEAGPEPYVETVLRLIRDRAAYERLALSSRALFETRLNWNAAGAALVAALRDAITLGPRAR